MICCGVCVSAVAIPRLREGATFPLQMVGSRGTKQGTVSQV